MTGETVTLSIPLFLAIMAFAAIGAGVIAGCLFDISPDDEAFFSDAVWSPEEIDAYMADLERL